MSKLQRYKLEVLQIEAVAADDGELVKAEDVLARIGWLEQENAEAVQRIAELERALQKPTLPVESRKSGELYNGYVDDLKKRIFELEAMVEEMRSCRTCRWINGGDAGNYPCLSCNRFCNWEFRQREIK